MKMIRWTVIAALSVLSFGCGKYACKQDVVLGMDEQEALQRVPGIHLIAEEMARKEYACQLFDDCDTSHWFRSTTPYKLGFQNARLLRIEINQDELTRQELNRAVEMRYNYYWW